MKFTFFLLYSLRFTIFQQEYGYKDKQRAERQKETLQGVNSHISHIIPIVRHYMLLEHPSLLLWQSLP